MGFRWSPQGLFETVEELKRTVADVDARACANVNSETVARVESERMLRREIDELKADIRELRQTVSALLIAKNQAQASGAGLAGMLREAADEAAEIEDEAAEAAAEEAREFAEFLKKYGDTDG